MQLGSESQVERSAGQFDRVNTEPIGVQGVSDFGPIANFRLTDATSLISRALEPGVQNSGRPNVGSDQAGYLLFHRRSALARTARIDVDGVISAMRRWAPRTADIPASRWMNSRLPILAGSFQ